MLPSQRRCALALAASAAAAAVYAVLRKRRRSSRRDDGGGLSSRGQRLTAPALPYLGGVLAAFADPYDEATGEGVILLAVAENKLTWRTLKKRVAEGLATLPDWVANYGPMEGQAALREPLAAFLEARVVSAPVDPDHLSCATGVGAALSNLFYAICEAGDVVLIPAPYYSAFDSDLRAVADLRREPVALRRDRGYMLTAVELEAAFVRAGGRARALLLTNPHNPLGRCLTRGELAIAVAFCERHRMHLVSDEIYALSHHAGQPSNFVSMGEFKKGELGERTHVLWGLSKDFGMSGLRFGVTWTQNTKILAALATAAVFTCVPGPCQALVADMLGDDAFCDAYLEENSAALAAGCAAVTAALDKLDLPYLLPNYGIYIWCDFSSLLPAFAGGRTDAAALFAAEARLNDLFVTDLKLVLTPGDAQHAPEPGWFRICFAFVEAPVLAVALGKLAAYVEASRATTSLDPARLRTRLV